MIPPMILHCPNCSADTEHENGSCLACGTPTVGASEDTRRAMQENPDYWIAWYTFKSLALVAVIGVLGYTLGKNKR